MRSLFEKALIFAVVMALVAGGGWLGRKAYRRVTQRRLMAEAGDCIAKKDYKQAALCLRRAIQINPYGVQAHKMMADMLDSLEMPAALDWRESVVKLQPDNFTNRIQWAKTAIKYKDFHSAATALSGVDEQSQQTVAFHEVVGALEGCEGRMHEAETNFQEAYRLDPTNETLALDLATFHLVSTNREVSSAARTWLTEVPAHSPLWPIAVHELLGDAVSHKRFEQALAYSDAIIKSPAVSFGDKIQRLSILRGTKNPDYASYLVSVEADATRSSRSAYALGQWMLEADGGRRALAWLDDLPQEIRTNQPVPLIITDCQIEAKDWKGILALTDQQDWDEFNYYRYALQSYAQRSLGQQYVADNSWHKALRSTSHQLARLEGLSDLTARWGLGDRRLEVLTQIMDEFPDEKSAPEMYAGELYREGRTKDLEAFYAGLSAKNPDDMRFKNNVANLSLLQNSDPDNSHRLAKEAYATATNDPNFATTYAYSLFLQGRTDQALSVLSSINPDYLRNPSIAVYYGYIEAKSGHKELARGPLQRASDVMAAMSAHKMPAVLLPEEMEMVRAAQASL